MRPSPLADLPVQSATVAAGGLVLRRHVPVTGLGQAGAACQVVLLLLSHAGSTARQGAPARTAEVAGQAVLHRESCTAGALAA